MTIKVNCNNCHHLSHTGSFTKGGAKPMCTHPDGPRNKDGSLIPAGVIPYKRDWSNERNDHAPYIPKQIPKWCPLLNGCIYNRF